jgi:hypothetical protein
VPWRHIADRLDVRSTATMVQFFHHGQLVKTHPRKQRGKQTDLGDYPPEKIAFHMRTPTWCRRQALGIGPACVAVIEELLAENALVRLRAAQGVLGLAERHDPGRLEAACGEGHRRRGSVLPHHQGHPRRRHRGHPDPTSGRRRRCPSAPARPRPTVRRPHFRWRRYRHPPAHCGGLRRRGQDQGVVGVQRRYRADQQRGRLVTARPAGRAAADQAASNPASLLPTATDTGPERVTAERVTVREITEFLRHLAELRAGGDDPGERAAFMARKAELFTRIAADTPATTAPEGRTP